ncbi:MAG: DUF1552 domain-containing protein [Deltaproteobacteria bacterium]|nr:DUF1552 domain-containing protein [Deltaproteobacteria bacterium]
MRSNRRQLLAASGLLAGSLFLPSRARAGLVSDAPPKRLIVFFTQHGTVYGNWRMRPGGVGAASDFQADLSALTAAEFSQVLRPLHPMRRKLIVLDGLAMTSVESDQIGNGHDYGTRGALTCARLVNGAAGGPSIDQIVARQLHVAGRLDSLELAVVGTRNGGAIWRDAGQSISPDRNPDNVYSRLFPSSFTSPTPTNAARVAAAQGSVLDLTKGEYAALAPRLSGADRQKVELHRDLVRDLELRLQGMPSAPQCARPGEPQLDGSSDGSFYESRAEAMFSLTAAALSCDLTRVVSIQLDQLNNGQIGAPPGDVHADFAHLQENNDFARQMMTNYGACHARQFLSLLQKLDAVPEGNGTLLDSCAVVWVSEIANGIHDYNPWPVVIGGGALRPGRYIYEAQDQPNPSTATGFPNYVPNIGPPHNKLWVSVARAVGANISQVGVSEVVTPTGTRIDCTGPLGSLA